MGESGRLDMRGICAEVKARGRKALTGGGGARKLLRSLIRNFPSVFVMLGARYCVREAHEVCQGG